MLKEKQKNRVTSVLRLLQDGFRVYLHVWLPNSHTSRTEKCTERMPLFVRAEPEVHFPVFSIQFVPIRYATTITTHDTPRDV